MVDVPAVRHEWRFGEDDHAGDHNDTETEAEPEAPERAGHFNEEVGELERLYENASVFYFVWDEMFLLTFAVAPQVMLISNMWASRACETWMEMPPRKMNKRNSHLNC